MRFLFALLALTACHKTAPTPAEQPDAPTCDCLSGTCGAVCTPEVIADNQAMPSSLFDDGTDVYWTNAGDGTILKRAATPLRASGPTVVATGQQLPTSFTAMSSGGDKTLFWYDAGTGKIMELIAGGMPQGIADASYQCSIHVQPGQLLWTNPAKGEVWTLALGSDGAPAGAAVMIADKQGMPAGIVPVTNHGVVWANTTDGTLVQATYDPTQDVWAHKPIVFGLAAPTELATDDEMLYWIEGGTISGAPVTASGFGTPTTIATNQADPASMLCDGYGLFWANRATGEVMVAPYATTNGSVHAAASGITGLVAIAISPTSSPIPTCGWATAGQIAGFWAPQ